MKKLFCLLCLATITLSNVAIANQFGGMSPGAINTQNIRDLRFHEANTREKQRSAIVQPKTKQMEQPIIPDVMGNLKSIKFTNNAYFTSAQLQEATKSYIGQPLSPENIAQIRKALMKFYQNKGFYSAIPIIVSQNGSTGELVIEMQEGSKNSITFE